VTRSSALWPPWISTASLASGGNPSSCRTCERRQHVHVRCAKCVSMLYNVAVDKQGVLAVGHQPRTEHACAPSQPCSRSNHRPQYIDVYESSKLGTWA
jgi:hypothetical protein